MEDEKIKHQKKIKVLKVLCRDSLLFSTRYFFRKRHKRKFIIGDHHKTICDTLEKVYRGEITRLMINIPPRYGKTELAVKNFMAHAIALNPSALFLHLSGSADLAMDNSSEVKDIVECDAFQELYPEIKVRKDTRSKKKWYTTAGGGIYAVSAGGQVTGFGAGKVDEEKEDIEESENIDEFFDSLEKKEGFGGAIIIDDPIKPDEADNKLARRKINFKFDSTIKNRVNSRNTPIMIIMHRLHPDDLCGHLIKREGEDWHVLSVPAIVKVKDENGDRRTAIWDFKHTLEELDKLRKMNQIVFERQYLQNPKPLTGLLYTKFKTYSEITWEIGRVQAYIDVADTGKDYLCCIIYTEHLNLFYLLDVYYSQDKNEITEPEVAQRMEKYQVNEARIESNSGGRAFCRNVERISEDSGNYRTTFDPFYQGKNKEARISNESSTIQNQVMYPDDWAYRWPGFYDSMTEYMAAGGNEFDDAQDTLTGVVEYVDVELEVEYR